MKKSTDPLLLKRADWLVAYDYMLEQGIVPRKPKQGADYNCYVRKINTAGYKVLAEKLPKAGANIRVPQKVMIDICLFDTVAVTCMLDFLGLKRNHRIKADPKFTKVRGR